MNKEIIRKRIWMLFFFIDCPLKLWNWWSKIKIKPTNVQKDPFWRDTRMIVYF